MDWAAKMVFWRKSSTGILLGRKEGGILGSANRSIGEGGIGGRIFSRKLFGLGEGLNSGTV